MSFGTLAFLLYSVFLFILFFIQVLVERLPRTYRKAEKMPELWGEVEEMAGVLKLFQSGTSAWRGMSTEAVKKAKDGTVLFRRLVALGLGNSDAKVADVLDEWVREGPKIRRHHVSAFASQQAPHRSSGSFILLFALSLCE